MATLTQSRRATQVGVALGYVVLSGLLMGVSLPPYDLPLGFVALAPFFAVIWTLPRLLVPLLGLLHGWLVGMTAMGFGVALSEVGALLPFLIYGVAVGVVGLVARDVGDLSRLRAVLWVGAAGVLLEYLESFLFIPFHAAMAVWRDTPFLQLAMVTGVWGLSLFLWSGWAALGYALAMRRWTPALTALVGIGVAIHTFGMLAIWWSEPRGVPLRVAAVQGDPTDAELIQQVRRSEAQFVVIPEASIMQEQAIPLAKEMGVPVMVGFWDNGYNCAAIAFPGGRMTAPYHKMHPYIVERSTIPGTHAEPFPTEFGLIGAAICYDTMFTDTLRQLCRQRAVLVGVPTNDPVASNLAYHHLHGAIHTIRAAEHRIPIVRAESWATSMIVNRVGRLVASAGEGPAVLTATVQVAPSGTLYTLLGDYLPLICLVALAWGVLRRRRGCHKSSGV